MYNKKKPIKIIIQHSNEVVNFADFMNEVLDFEEDDEKQEDKQTSSQKV
jgi:hypothetical protein